MYQWARPTIAVPTHGERRHLLEHAALAKDLQVSQAIAPRNGDMVRLAPGAAQIIDEVPSGRLYIDAGVVTPENGDALRERRHASFNGMLTVSMALDGLGKVAAGPTVRAMGLPGDEEYTVREATDDLAEEAANALRRTVRRRPRRRPRRRGRHLPRGQERGVPHLEAPPGRGDDRSKNS